MIRIIFIAFCLFVAFLSSSELHQRQGSEHLLIEVEPLNEAQRLSADGYDSEAILLAEFASETARSPRERQAAEKLKETLSAEKPFQSQVISFIAGALSGEPRDIEGLIGSLSLDLFVIGDIRDLAVQGYKEIQYGTGDTLILALSAIGLATTLSPPVDFAPALLKILRRTGALGKRFIKSLSKMSRRALGSGDFSRLHKVAEDFGRATRALGPQAMSRVMKHIDDPADLARLSRAAQKNPRATYALVHLSDGRAVNKLGKSADIGSLAKAARRTSRLGKGVAKAVSILPDKLLIAIFLLAVFFAIVAIAAALPNFGRRRGSPNMKNGIYKKRSDSHMAASIPVLTDIIK
ncbi:MAG: hypothetical protein DHS20C01_25680 [marine bacterium B5-7]|nr:MAG: hypothetical protein DHS20C01_25680 [marine bacterium B5-7]